MMDDKTILFEQTPVPKAVMQLAVPTILSSLVMVIYNLADTYFVGMMNNPVQNAAVTLAAPVLLAFNAVNNLFGVGSSSMMSRALGRRDYESVRRSSAFGFYCALFFGLLFSVLCTVGLNPLIGKHISKGGSHTAFLCSRAIGPIVNPLDENNPQHHAHCPKPCTEPPEVSPCT